MEIKCIICGNVFQTNTWNASLCSRKCRLERSRLYNRERRLREKEERKNEQVIDNRTKSTIKRNPEPMKQLTRDAIEARKAGMTYGKFMARRKIERW